MYFCWKFSVSPNFFFFGILSLKKPIAVAIVLLYLFFCFLSSPLSASAAGIAFLSSPAPFSLTILLRHSTDLNWCHILFSVSIAWFM